ncbi:MAG: hypothetical protein KY469_10875 [Actinobacteria bacterium]|nr:hypothetical protein [Actinomycetota bacterium]
MQLEFVTMARGAELRGRHFWAAGAGWNDLGLRKTPVELDKLAVVLVFSVFADDRMTAWSAEMVDPGGNIIAGADGLFSLDRWPDGVPDDWPLQLPMTVEFENVVLPTTGQYEVRVSLEGEGEVSFPVLMWHSNR